MGNAVARAKLPPPGRPPRPNRACSPWSTVTASRRVDGACRSRWDLRRRRRAVESLPPETAATMVRCKARSNSEKRLEEVGVDQLRQHAARARSCLTRSLSAPEMSGIALADFAEGGAGDFALLEADQRDAELQHHFGRLLGLRIFLAGGEEGFGRVAVFLLPEQRLAEPEVRVRRLGVGREAGDVVAEALFGGGVVARKHELVGIAVEFVRIVGRGQRGNDGAIRAACSGCRRFSRRRARGVFVGGAGNHVAVGVDGDGAEGRGRRAGAVRRRLARLARARFDDHFLDALAAAGGRGRARSGSLAGAARLRRRWRLNDGAVGLCRGVGLLLCAAFKLLEAELVVFLHLPHLLLHLQDLEVQLLDAAVELADLLFECGDARIARLGELDHAVAAIGSALAAEHARQADLWGRDVEPDAVARVRCGPGQKEDGKRATQD